MIYKLRKILAKFYDNLLTIEVLRQAKLLEQRNQRLHLLQSIKRMQHNS